MGPQAKRSPLHALAAESPSFSYASSAKKAVEDASIFLSKCDIILLFWPNGCVKSALSRLLSGLYQPQLRKAQACGGAVPKVIALQGLIAIPKQPGAVFQGTALESALASPRNFIRRQNGGSPTGKQSETLLNLFAMQQQTEPTDSFFVHIRILAVPAWHYAALP